jgi:hypothetical protein
MEALEKFLQKQNKLGAWAIRSIKKWEVWWRGTGYMENGSTRRVTEPHTCFIAA